LFKKREYRTRFTVPPKEKKGRFAVVYLYSRLKERKLDTYIQYIVAVACPDKLHTIYITLHTVV